MQVLGVFQAEFVNVLLGEIQLVVVEKLQVGGEEFGGHVGIHFLASVVGLLEPVGHSQGDLALIRSACLGAKKGIEKKHHR